MAAGPDASPWSEFAVSRALTAGAGVVAHSYRGTPWLAADGRERRALALAHSPAV